MKAIGITGGIGAGKSEVLSILKECSNCRILLADELAKQLEGRNNVCYTPLIELLGRDILDEDEQINPKAMADKIFSDKNLLEKVNEIIHPAVKNKILEELDYEEKRGAIDYFFLEAALLIEDGYDLILDEIWYIYASEETRRKRLKESRGYSDAKIDKILSKQLKDETFRRYCKVVINNDGNVLDTREQIVKLLTDNNTY